jgi:UDP-N-acetylmuramate dehydrogenase
MISINDIRKFYRGMVLLSEPLNKYTSLKIGGPVDYYFEPMDKEDGVNIIGYLQKQDVQFVAIGKGSNLLVSDDGFRGAVVNMESALKSIYTEEQRVIAEAGVSLIRFVDYCIQRSLKGVEMLAGIPGTIGGAVIMNAGAYGGEISNYLLDAEIIRTGTIVILKREEIGFSYRHTSLQPHDVVLSASFQLPSGDRKELMKIRNDFILQRNKKHPVNLPNCGSVFKNPPGLPAAKFIEEAGLRGSKSGNAQISEKHANFIVNLGDASSTDVLDLIICVHKTVLEKSGVSLDLEVKLLGFPEENLKEILL